MNKKIVLSGYYGFNNTGDEAVLAGILATFRQLGINADVTVLSSNPVLTMRQHPGIKSVHRYELANVIKAIRCANFFISGGGSLVQDVTSAQSAFYYLGILRLAQILGCKTMIYAQGVGPLNRGCVKKFTASAFNRAKTITVRDADSRDLLESIGVGGALKVVADPAFLVEADADAADKILKEKGLAGKEIIGVSLRGWTQDPGWVEAVRGISRAAEDLGVELVYIPMQEPNDIEFHKYINHPKPAVLLDNLQSLAVVKGVISRLSFLVGMRLHSLIFAASEGVPFLPIVYDPKVKSFVKTLDMDAYLDVQIMTEQSVYESVMDAWQKRQETAKKLRSRNEHIIDSALESGRILRDIL